MPVTSVPAPPARDDNAMRVMHVNINCRDFDRSVAFYQLIGFRPYSPVEPGAPLGVMGRFGEVGLGPVLGLPDNCDGRFMALSFGDEPGGAVLDLIEWTEPRVAAEPRRSMAQPGVARICLKVRSCAEVHQRLVAQGHAVVSPPTSIDLKGYRFNVFCCEGPDGVVMEFMEVLS
jgi:catechol 2,3-dioxygenase-like lactoylglutathione lyase family enzyme